MTDFFHLKSEPKRLVAAFEERLGEADQSTHRASRHALDVVAVALAGVHHAGHVDVNPVVDGDEFSQESGSVAGTALRYLADVQQVSQRAVGHLLGEVLEERHSPNAIAGHGAALLQKRVETGLGGEDAAGGAGTRHTHSTGQGGNVQNDLRLEGVSVAKCIGQNQSTFRVSVVHLDCLAVHRHHHVTRLVRPSTRQILTERRQSNHVHFRLNRCQSQNGADNIGGTTHISSHSAKQIKIIKIKTLFSVLTCPYWRKASEKFHQNQK